MIIFDTNALFGLRRDTPKFDLLRAFKLSGSQIAAVPWMVLEELVAQQVVPYVTAHDRAFSAIKELNRRSPWRASSVRIPPREIEEAKAYWRAEYSEVLTVLETSADNAKLALAREAYVEKPAKIIGDKNNIKVGARDVAIWLSVVGYLKDNPGEEVFFVCNNHRDFGRGVDYVSPMAEDIAGMESRLKFLPLFEDFISRFTQEIDVASDRARDLLSQLGADSIAAVGRHAVIALAGRTFDGTRYAGSGTFEFCQWTGWVTQPEAFLHSVISADGHKIGADEWYTAVVDWILVGAAGVAKSVDWGGSPVNEIGCRWRTKVLFSTDARKPVQVVSSESPKRLDVNEQSELQPLIVGMQKSSAAGASPSQLLAEFYRRIFPNGLPDLSGLMPPSYTPPDLSGLMPPSYTPPDLSGLIPPDLSGLAPRDDPSELTEGDGAEDEDVDDQPNSTDDDGSGDTDLPGPRSIRGEIYRCPRAAPGQGVDAGLQGKKKVAANPRAFRTLTCPLAAHSLDVRK